MERDKFLLLLDELLQLPEGTLKGPERMEELEHWDSLAMMSFIALVDEHYGLTLSPRQFLKCDTIADLMALAGAPA